MSQLLFRSFAAAALALAALGQAHASAPLIVHPGIPNNGVLDVLVPADGLPFVVYQSSSGVKALKCGTPTCDRDNTTASVASMTVRRLRLALGVDGLPIVGISVHSPSGGLRMARCLDARCGSVSLTMVDSTNLGANTDHALVMPADGRPLFAYYDSNSQDLKFARCDDEKCSSSQVSVVDSVGIVGISPAITLVANLPQIAYNANNVGLKLARCSTLACDGANTISTLTTDHAIDIAMLTGRDGAALIAYKHDVATQDALRMIKCGNAACSTQTAFLLDSVEFGNGLGAGVHMRAGADGLPVLAYLDVSFGATKLLRCTRPDCATTSITTAHAPAGYVLTTSTPAALAISAQGTPLLGYSVSGPGLTLNFCNTRSCQ